jgi:hypothetical protein
MAAITYRLIVVHTANYSMFIDARNQTSQSTIKLIEMQAFLMVQNRQQVTILMKLITFLSVYTFL